MRLQNWTACALVIAGCANVESSMTILGTAAPTDDECKFTPDGDEFLLNIFFDAANADSLALALKVRNDLQGNTINFGGQDSPDNFIYPTTITPLRMDFRFECDTNGFSDELGPLFVPQFSTDQPFCLQKDTREFQGFDVVPASGGAIQSNGGLGIVFVKPITTQLAHAIGDTFALGVLADRCCNSLVPGGCTEENLRNLPAGTNDDCGQLQTEFNKIAPDKLSVNKLDDVEKFRPYAIYDWAYSGVRPQNAGMSGAGPGYPMRIRGVLEGVTGDGSIVSSTEYFEIINICANCGQTKCTAL
jgi:hypothetical protein